jgi:hypothetical protein
MCPHLLRAGFGGRAHKMRGAERRPVAPAETAQNGASVVSRDRRYGRLQRNRYGRGEMVTLRRADLLLRSNLLPKCTPNRLADADHSRRSLSPCDSPAVAFRS